MSRAPSRASILLTAFETVALESFSSAAAPAKEWDSTILAKIASPSKSGSLAIKNQNWKRCVSIVSISNSWLCP